MCARAWIHACMCVTLVCDWLRAQQPRVALLGAEIAAHLDHVNSDEAEKERQPMQPNMDDDLFQLRQLP